MKIDTKATILFAVANQDERELFLELITSRKLDYTIVFPESIRDVDRMVSSNGVDLIITDLYFNGGAFADWLSLWPRPFILLADYDENTRLDELIRDEACSFIIRDSALRHVAVLPTMIRKVLNVRESLDRQNVHLQISERRYLDLVSALPDIVYTLDGEGCFTYINDSIHQLGYTPTELIGHHFSEILQAEDIPLVSREIVVKDLEGQIIGPDLSPKLFDERRSGSRMTRNLEVRLRSKPPLKSNPATGKVDSFGEISAVGYTLPEYEKSTIGTVGIIRDVTVRKQEEIKLKENLRVKEMLLKEIHHRVKNNLQVVSSLLNLQGGVIEDPVSSLVFRDCQTQIQAMAMVHEQLYRSDDLQTIDMSLFLSSLIVYLFHVYDVDESRISSEVSSDGVTLSIDQAIPIALIVNELVSNALKHGLAMSEGKVMVSLVKTGENRLRLEVRDTGKGMPADFNITDSDTLGFQLVQALCEQIGGSLSWTSLDGVCFVLDFPWELPDPMHLF